MEAKKAPASLGLEPKAEVLFLCGKEIEKGLSGAEFALVDYLESTTKFYRFGKPVPEEEYDIASAEHKWIVTLFAASGDKKFVFSTNLKELQEFDLSEKEKEKKIGQPRVCKK